MGVVFILLRFRAKRPALATIPETLNGFLLVTDRVFKRREEIVVAAATSESVMIVPDLTALLIVKLLLIYFGSMLVLDQWRQSADTLGQPATDPIRQHSAQAYSRPSR